MRLSLGTSKSAIEEEKRRTMRFRTGLAILFLFPAAALAEPSGKCDQAAFAAVVGEASAQLNAMNSQGKADFQRKLQLLKQQRGWSDDEFIAAATPFVQNSEVAAFDQGNKRLLENVAQLGTPAPMTASLTGLSARSQGNHCAMLEKLRGLMVKLVDNTQAKWSNMIGQVDVALNVAQETAIRK